MKVDVKKTTKLKRTILIRVEKDELVTEKKAAYQEIGKELKVPGFRPGNVPMEVMEKHHSKLLKEEFLKRLIPFYYSKALQENNIAPAGYPRIYDVELSENELVFSAEVEVNPELDIKDSDYKGVKINAQLTEVSDSEVDKILINLRDGIKKIIEKDPDDGSLAKWAGYADFSKLKEAIKSEVRVQKLRDRRRMLDEQVRQCLLKKIKLDVPDSVIERHHKELMDREIYNLRLRGVPDGDIEKYKKDLDEKLKPIAKDDVKLSYILDAIAKKENLKADEDKTGEVALGFVLSEADYS